MSAFFLSSYSDIVHQTLVMAVQPQLGRSAQSCVDMQGLSHLMHMSGVLIVTGMQKPHWVLYFIKQ